jgi:hypothetical protein
MPPTVRIFLRKSVVLLRNNAELPNPPSTFCKAKVEGYNLEKIKIKARVNTSTVVDGNDVELNF